MTIRLPLSPGLPVYYFPGFCSSRPDIAGRNLNNLDVTAVPEA